MDTHEKADLLDLTTKIVTAYVTKNPVGIAELRELIASVSHGLATVEEQVTPKLKPAVPIKRSVTRAHIACLEGEPGPDPVVCIAISPLRRADLAIENPAH